MSSNSHTTLQKVVLDIRTNPPKVWLNNTLLHVAMNRKVAALQMICWHQVQHQCTHVMCRLTALGSLNLEKLTLISCSTKSATQLLRTLRRGASLDTNSFNSCLVLCAIICNPPTCRRCHMSCPDEGEKSEARICLVNKQKVNTIPGVVLKEWQNNPHQKLTTMPSQTCNPFLTTVIQFNKRVP